MSWTQPICSFCYNSRYPGREPLRIADDGYEKCCDCGKPTSDGIYFRVDPSTVKFPQEMK